MVPGTRKVVVHTDVLLDFLTHRGPERSALREIMGKRLCYTTVFNAIELFAIARTPRETRAVEQALSAMKILGLNAKHAPKFGALVASAKGARTMNLLVAGLCIESRLPLLTAAPAVWKGIRGLAVVTPEGLRREDGARRSA